MVYARYSHQSTFTPGEWNWGRWGGPINIFALVYTVYIVIWLPFPSTLPVTGANMNYCGPIMGFVLLVALGLWIGWARKKWPGPDVGIMDFVVKTS